MGKLQVTSYGLQDMSYKLQVLSRQRRDLSYELQVTSGAESRREKAESKFPHLTSHISHLISYISLLIAILCCISISAGAQTKWSYEYDNAGNRLNRTIIMPAMIPPPTPPQDSIETIIEEVGNPIASVQNTETGDEKSQKIYTDVLSETQITIYPNPTKGELSVESGELRVDNVEIFDIMGRKQKAEGRRQNEILNSPLNLIQGSILNSIDISHLPTGIYFIRIHTEAGTVVRRVVKN